MILLIVLLILVLLVTSFLLIYRQFKQNKIHIARLKATLKEKNNTEKALKQSEENYQTLVKTINEGLIVLDNESKIEFLNYKACKILGVSHKNELEDQDFKRFLLTTEDKKLFQEKAELQKMGISDHYEVKLKNVAGDVMWVNISSAPILDDNLKTKGSVSLIYDVTEKKKSEQTYSELTANLNQKIKQLNCMYDISDISGVPGITFEEIIQKSIEIIPVGLKYSHDVGVQIVFDNKEYTSKNFRETPWEYTVPIKVQKKKLGFIRVVYLEEKPLINKDPFHFNEKILLKNISEKFGQIVEAKNLEKVLFENQRKLQEVQRIARIGNWEQDLERGDCTFSETFFDIAEISPERQRFFDYHKLLEMIHPDDKAVFSSIDQKLRSNTKGGDVTGNFRIITHDGTVKHLHLSGRVVTNEQNIPLRLVFTIQDVTDQKYNQELQYHAEVALKTSEAKQQVIAGMSYEMRTPITGIMGMVDFLLKTDLSTQQLEQAKTIKESSQGLMSIINNILDLYRIEAGKFRLNNRSFNIFELFERVRNLFNALTRNKEIKLHLEIDSSIPARMITDEKRLYQVMSSLVSFIIKYSEKGNVRVHIQLESMVVDKLVILVEVKDDCSVLDQNELKSLLNPSDYYHEAFLQKNDNSSLNLAISKKLVELLGGTIHIEKNKRSSRGNTITFTFFATLDNEENLRNKQQKSSERIISSIEGLRVLCVEDRKLNQKVINLMLSHVDCQVAMADNGREALELMEKNQFDIVLLDMVMPVMDGVTTLKNIKEKFKQHPPVIALTANVLEEDKEEYFAAGVADYISKPIHAPELYQKLAYWHEYHQKMLKKKKKK